MRGNNPVFNRAEGFNGTSTNAYGNQTYPGAGGAQPGFGQPNYSDPSTWGTGTAVQEQGQQPYGLDTGRTGDRMTIDSVVQKTGISLFVVVAVAAVTWYFTGNPVTDAEAYRTLGLLSMVGGISALVLSLVNSFKREVNPALVLLFCLAEGLVVGAISKISVAVAGNEVLVGAVVGTIAAVAGTLAAYKFLNITVSDKFRKFVVAAMFGFVALSLLDAVLYMFNSSIGINGYGTVGLIASVVGLLIAVFMLLLDFDFIERGIAAGLPEKESWRAAFGITVTIIWIYMNLLRIMTILQRD